MRVPMGYRCVTLDWRIAPLATSRRIIIAACSPRGRPALVLLVDVRPRVEEQAHHLRACSRPCPSARSTRTCPACLHQLSRRGASASSPRRARPQTVAESALVIPEEQAHHPCPACLASARSARPCPACQRPLASTSKRIIPCAVPLLCGIDQRGHPVLVLLVGVRFRIDEQAHHPRAVLAPQTSRPASARSTRPCSCLLTSAPASTSKRIIPAPCFHASCISAVRPSRPLPRRRASASSPRTRSTSARSPLYRPAC